MYGRIFLFLLIFLISCSLANTCKDDSECPSYHSKLYNTMIDQRCESNSCKPYIRGRTCGRCNKNAIFGKCCDKNIVPDEMGMCNCKEPQCTKKADCWIGELSPLPMVAWTYDKLPKVIFEKYTANDVFGKPTAKDISDEYIVHDNLDIFTDNDIFDESTANDIFYDCIDGACIKPKCGRCNEKAINGQCCNGKLHDDGYCWCTCKTGLDCPLDAYCRGDWCISEAVGKTCGDCGKEPINGRCCGSGVKGHAGLCFCSLNKECISWNDCSGNSVCCSNNHCYKNVVAACPDGTYAL